MSKLNVEVSVPVSILKEGKYFVAYTPALDISTSATSYEKVQKRFGELVEIFLEELIEKGTLEYVLKNLGWKRSEKSWIPPMLVSQESQSISVPVSA